MEYSKVKSKAKVVVTKSDRLEQIVLRTMKQMSDIVGATLGPSGRPILIERQEDLPSLISKDGVTVAKSIGLIDPVAHCVMQAARDAAIRTATEAGDGTTTATVLAEAIVRRSNAFCKKHPAIPPQIVVRTLERAFKDVIEPYVRKVAFKADTYEQSKGLLFSVAKMAGNGDEDLAKAVMEAVELVGEKGNATIMELSGPSRYEVERIEGFPVGKGHEESCARYYPMFLNDKAAQRCYLDKPVFLLYDGNVIDFQSILPLLSLVGMENQEDASKPNNIVVVAHGFSDAVLAHLGFNFANPSSINIFPLITPQNMMQNCRTHFLQDLAAFTGAAIFDPITRPTSTGRTQDLGSGMEYFESFRFRSTIVGKPDELFLQDRIAQLQKQKEDAASQYDASILAERIGILTGGIAKIRVYGASSGELREKRDRCEDAVCAVRGASEHGVLPGGGRVLLNLASLFFKKGMFGTRSAISSIDPQGILFSILVPSFEEPVRKLLANSGKNSRETEKILKFLYNNPGQVYDAMEMKFVAPFESGILDSTPAVLEAIRNSLSIASLLGTLGGVVVFPRDEATERQEARDTMNFLRDANTDETEGRM